MWQQSVVMTAAQSSRILRGEHCHWSWQDAWRLGVAVVASHAAPVVAELETPVEVIAVGVNCWRGGISICGAVHWVVGLPAIYFIV